MTTIAEALANPASSIHRKLATARKANETVVAYVARRVAGGATSEQAWLEVCRNAKAVA